MKLDTSSFIPIYEQIKKDIRDRISLGILKPADPLPSVRDLASELIINPNTVARAYRELEIEGFIYSVKGKGCYVSDSQSSLLKRERIKAINEIFDKAIADARKFNLDWNEIEKLLKIRLRMAGKKDSAGGRR